MLINYTEFKNKWNGKFCEMGGSAAAKNQCVDLANAYISEVLGLPIVLGTNAVDFPKKCLTPNYEYIKNTVTAVPIQGDIIIYKSPDGIGHIDIFDNGNDSKYQAFSQNWPVGSVCKLVNHVYTGTYEVVGWLRGKPVINSEDNMTEQEKIMLDFIKLNGITEGQLREGYGYIKDGTIAEKDKQIQTLQARVLSLEKDQKDLADRITALESNIQADLKLIADWQNSAESAKKALDNANKTNIEITAEKNKYKSWYEAALKEQVNKYSAWELIKMGIDLLVKKSNK